MHEAALRRFLLLILSAAAAAGSFYLAFRYLLPWCLPFLLALLIAALLEPVVLHLQRRLRFQRGFSALLLTLTLLFLLGGLLSLLGTTLLSQLNALLAAAPAFFDAIPAAAENLLARLERFHAGGPDWLTAYLQGQLLQTVNDMDSLLRSLSSRAVAALAQAAAALPGGLLAVATCVLAIFFTSASYPALCAAARRFLPEKAMERLRRFRTGAMESLGKWLRAQLTLSCITFFELLAGFLLMRQRYALLLAFLITLLDALPVFGTGTVLIPWGLLCFARGEARRGVGFLVLYGAAALTRQALEPRLLGRQIGLSPLITLLALYTGFRLCGVAGMILFPIGAIFLRQVLAPPPQPEG